MSLDMSLDMLTLISVLIGYVLGTIPFGLLLTRLTGQGDIRDVGSGNIGATNVLRSGNKLLAMLTLLGDAAKGYIAVHIAVELAGQSAAYPTAIACLLGHVYPVWLRFKGGKGVATFVGLILALSPLTGVVFLLCWTLIAAISRYSSLAALLSITLSLPLLFALGELETLTITLIMTALIFYTHRDNLRRLWTRTETRIGQ